MTHFIAKTEKIDKLSQKYSERIKELENIFDGPSIVYIDYANVYFWSRKLGWHVDIKRLKQLLDSFSNIVKVRFYNGTLKSDNNSVQLIKDAYKLKYEVTTKPVKIMKLSIDVSSIPTTSPVILEKFIDKSLLRNFSIETVEMLNEKLKELNEKGILFIEHRKCNFDVEIARDIYLDHKENGIRNFVLWSGDSDFADPVIKLINDKKKVVIFGTARRISVELATTGAQIFEIKKVKDFICRSGEMKAI